MIGNLGSFVSANAFPFLFGLTGSAARPMTVAVELSKGLHHLDVGESHGVGADDFRMLWQGPGLPLEPIPADRLSHIER